MARILIADDSPVVRRLISITLRRFGHTVDLAEDGRAALNLLETAPIDLAIIDLDMPEIPGLDLLHQIRSSSDLAQLPVVMLTASGATDDLQQAMRAGANAFLTKPAGSNDLLRTIDAVLRDAASGGNNRTVIDS
jgi:CheY-like chemotaxis protein